jgi:ribose/xylose/arabinose/galactoside ABC-type transport system permease subunit
LVVAAGGRPGAYPWWRRLLLSEYLVLWLGLAYFATVALFVPAIATPESLANILADMLPLLAVAIGQTFVLIVAGIDLSVTSIIAMASVVGASVMTGDGGYLGGSALAAPAAILVMLLVGALIGALNGLCVTRLGMPPFIVTLAGMMFFSGAALWYTTFHTATSSIANLPRSFVAIGQGSAGPIPNSFWVVLALAVLAHVILTRTVLGQRLYAIGRNPKAAAVAGVPVARCMILAFMISGVCAAVSSILYTGRLETGTPILGERILLDVIGAVVIGGTSLFGGKGKVLWTVTGVLFLVLIDTSLKILGLSLFFVLAIKGGVILLAAVIDALRTRFLRSGA